MGLFSSKKSSSTTNATTTNLGFSEVSGDALGIAGNGNIVTDGGAVKSAFDFGRAVLDENSNLAREVVQASGEIYQGYGQQLQSFAAKATADQGDKLAELSKWLIGGLVIVGALAFYRKARA